MSRKKWTSRTEITPTILRLREKRKWQIALRRYVLERNPSREYAPYFGLDIEKLRRWFETQFGPDQGWENFGKQWQFDHLVPVTCFDFSNSEELKLCWNFTNLRVAPNNLPPAQGYKLEILAARQYFRDLFLATGYSLCQRMVEKIDQLEEAANIPTDNQQGFIREHRTYLESTDEYTAFEFGLLNIGRGIADIKKEIEILKGLSKPGQ